MIVLAADHGGYLLKEEVKKDALRKAVFDLEKRFPSFYVCLKKGLFWDYFYKAESLDIITDSKDICRPINTRDKKRPLFRIITNSCEIRCEFFHAVTDGSGAGISVRAYPDGPVPELPNPEYR